MNYEDDLKPFLPPKIFDAHVHFVRRESWSADVQLEETDYKLKFGWHFGWSEALERARELIPCQELSVNAFGSPEKRVNRDDADAFTGSFVDGQRCFGMALASPADSPEALLARLRKYNLRGLKPYQSMVPGERALESIELKDLLTPEQLEMADQYRLAVTVHIPRMLRLADPLNLTQMEEWLKRYPRVRFIFAHLGRSYFLSCIKGRLERFADYENCWFDTAMVNSDRVLEYAFRHYPRKRLLFGTDSPIALLPGKSVEVNDQYVYMMGLPNCAFGTSIDASASPLVFTSFLYEQFNGIKLAAEAAGLDAGDIRDFFYNNAYHLFTEVYQCTL